MNTIDVHPVHEKEVSANGFMKLTEIRFDALVTMYDCATPIKVEFPKFLSPERKLPPQWFKAEHRMTLEFIRDADPYLLGCVLKEMYSKLNASIKSYENSIP